jgi:hypothetical protein
MSKARPPKRKEEYMPSDKIEDYCNDILKAGTHLASVSKLGYPKAESVSNAIACVFNVVKQYKLVEKWVTSRISNCKKECVTTKEICHVSFLACFLY